MDGRTAGCQAGRSCAPHSHCWPCRHQAPGQILKINNLEYLLNIIDLALQSSSSSRRYFPHLVTAPSNTCSSVVISNICLKFLFISIFHGFLLWVSKQTLHSMAV
ncbi:hypothetical protein BDA96_07G110300 [Sorghum bicolor]|uniref:Uncharacterized protein n=2 Tax=Sorghum bicolor TaxID=4558 RepID=A0A921UA61_SORBI|nr:hypothetical protein BDA96_07G110300 [Sorghum bicolor]OQU80276.1 hypothetical protein SORBI_3007G103666 [Sorghum bicolor]